MQVSLFNFSKRDNSTKQPTAEQITSGVSFTDLTLKEITNIDKPVLKLAGASLNQYTYNYAYIHDWGRYYFINTANLRHEDIYHIDLELDDLATYKTQILNTSAYILYASTGFNRWIKDDRFPIIARPPVTTMTFSNPTIDGNNVFDDEQVSPVMILTTVSQETGLTYWKMQKTSVDHLLDSLTRAGSNIWGALQEQFGDAMGSIISCVRLPINSFVIDADPLTDMYLGSYKVQDGESSYIQERPLAANFVLFRGRCGIPTGYLDFRVFEPYTRLKIRLPFLGLVDLAHQDYAGSVYYEGLLNLINGKLVWTLYNDEEYHHAVSTYSCQCGEYIPLAATQIQNASSLIESIAGAGLTLGGVISGNAAALGTGVLAATQGFYHLNDKSTNVIGSYSGSITEIINKRVEIISERMETAAEPDNITDIEGRPVCKVDLLSNYTGFVKTQGFSIDLNANLNVVKSINNKLDSGIYIE